MINENILSLDNELKIFINETIRKLRRMNETPSKKIIVNSLLSIYMSEVEKYKSRVEFISNKEIKDSYNNYIDELLDYKEIIKDQFDYCRVFEENESIYNDKEKLKVLLKEISEEIDITKHDLEYEDLNIDYDVDDIYLNRDILYTRLEDLTKQYDNLYSIYNDLDFYLINTHKQ